MFPNWLGESSFRNTIPPPPCSGGPWEYFWLITYNWPGESRPSFRNATYSNVPPLQEGGTGRGVISLNRVKSSISSRLTVSAWVSPSSAQLVSFKAPIKMFLFLLLCFSIGHRAMMSYKAPWNYFSKPITCLSQVCSIKLYLLTHGYAD